MLAPPTTTSPYYSSTTTDPMAGLTHFTDALKDSADSFLWAVLAFGVAALCIAIWRSIQPEVPGMVVLGVVIGAGAIFGLSKISDSYATLDAATGGLLGKLFSAAFALLPLLIGFALVWLLGRWLEGRY